LEFAKRKSEVGYVYFLPRLRFVYETQKKPCTQLQTEGNFRISKTILRQMCYITFLELSCALELQRETMNWCGTDEAQSELEIKIDFSLRFLLSSKNER